MLTQCPHCLTLFRVGPEHLKAAAGQVRCCRCHQAFNALQSLQNSPTPFVNGDDTTKADEAPATEQTIEHPPETTEISDWRGFMEQPPSNDTFEPMLPSLEASESKYQLFDDILEQDDGLEPEPDYLASSNESQMSELLDQDSSSLLLPDTDEPSDAPLDEPTTEPPGGPGNITAFTPTAKQTADEFIRGPHQPEAWNFKKSILKDQTIGQALGRSDYDSEPAFHADWATSRETPADDNHAFNFEAESAAPKLRKKFTLYWLFGSLLLLLPLASQIAWQLRDDLIHHNAGRQALNLICLVAGCEVPTPRALDKIIVQGRNLSSHPNKPEVLSLRLSIVNTAAFEQPFPQLGLTLYNETGTLIARRAFSASEYLPQEYQEKRMMPRAQPILIEMELVDPGKEVTGFSFDFY
jgi:predicted Zn finger-like uncharacterized protein